MIKNVKRDEKIAALIKVLTVCEQALRLAIANNKIGWIQEDAQTKAEIVLDMHRREIKEILTTKSTKGTKE